MNELLAWVTEINIAGADTLTAYARGRPGSPY